MKVTPTLADRVKNVIAKECDLPPTEQIDDSARLIGDLWFGYALGPEKELMMLLDAVNDEFGTQLTTKALPKDNLLETYTVGDFIVTVEESVKKMSG